MRKILLVVGTRPEAIKMAPLYETLQSMLPETSVKMCATAQHRQMLDQVLSLFRIVPDYDLNLMKAGQSLEELSANVLLGMRSVLDDAKPDLLLVHGDTTTTLMAALAGFYANTAVGHIEAGLRTHYLRAPFPEEMNRQVVSRLAEWHFAPTESARTNLLAEGVSSTRIHITGNTVIDSLHRVLELSADDQTLRKSIDDELTPQLGFDWRREPFVLVTGHRRENFGEGMEQVCAALRTLSNLHPHVRFIYPVHRNPNVLGPVTKHLSGLKNVHLLEPLDYLTFVNLLQHASVVLTDSGGIQEEAPSLGKPVLVMRDVTERPEAVAAGTVKLVGTNHDRIVENVSLLLNKGELWSAMTTAHNPYGDGTACVQIAQILKQAGWS